MTVTPVLGVLGADGVVGGVTGGFDGVFVVLVELPNNALIQLNALPS